MSTPLLLICVIGYFILLMIVAWATSRNSDNESFYVGNRSSNWGLVAYGMIGASLSGVTFLSVPGAVGDGAWSYFQMVLGYILGYVVIAQVLLPLYYRLNLTSIYTYLQKRFGDSAYKTGSAYFILSRIIGASFRLFLVAMVLDRFILSKFGIPFEATVAITIVLIWIYSFKGGIKTIVYTDTLQTTFMLLSAIAVIFFIGKELDWSISDSVREVSNSAYSKIFEWDVNKGNNFFKNFFSGMLITIVMTGLDQDMMQKNLSCKNIGDAQKNIYSMSAALLVVNILFLALGTMLYMYMEQKGIGGTNFGNEELMKQGHHLSMIGKDGVEAFFKKDQLFPFLSVEYFPPFIGILFILGLMAAAYSSADSALTALTTSFCVDFLGDGRGDKKIDAKTRYKVHIGFSIILFLVIIVFKLINKDSVINELFKVAGFTYGPLLGMFFFGILMKVRPVDKLIPIICIVAPILTFLIDKSLSAGVFGRPFELGFLVLLLNGLLTFLFLYLSSFFNEDKSSMDSL